MAGQKFAVGQFVEFEKSATPAFKPIGPYEVLRVQPADDARLRAYRIKSKAEPFERSVKEYEILAIPETRTSFRSGELTTNALKFHSHDKRSVSEKRKFAAAKVRGQRLASRR